MSGKRKMKDIYEREHKRISEDYGKIDGGEKGGR